MALSNFDRAITCYDLLHNTFIQFINTCILHTIMYLNGNNMVYKRKMKIGR